MAARLISADKFRWLFADTLVIVLGVLIALGLDDSWTDRRDRLQAIYDDPGCAPILARQEARQVRERDKILAIVCTDNPYEAVWQPAEGTCERFAAASGN